LLDHELIEWAATLPSAFKIDGGEGKAVFKRAMEPLLPHDVLYRPKMGFSVPLADWLRGPLAGRVREAVLGERLRDSGYFEPRELRRLVDEHQRRIGDHATPLWMLVMFEAFLRRHEQTAEAGEPALEAVA